MMFRNEYAFLSNMYEAEFEFEGITYRCAEAAFQSCKTEDEEVRWMFSGLTGPQAKKLGRKIALRPDWEEVKVDCMHDILFEKFWQNEELSYKLIEIAEHEAIVEDNTWGDTFWGKCNGKGKNVLGELLAYIAKEIVKAKPKAEPEPASQPKSEPKKESSGKITNYCIIDHAGSVNTNKLLYNKAFATAKAAGFDNEHTYTMKRMCQVYSPYAREITDKMKYFHRYNRTPKHVYIVCLNQFVPKAQFLASIWEQRNIPVSFIEEQPIKRASSLDEVSTARRCAMIWANAIGWSFSAPLFRTEECNYIDEYTRRPNMESESGSYGAKRFTNPESYIKSFRLIAPESECQEFYNHYKWLYKNNLLSECLDAGYRICPTCGRPISETTSQCQWCDTEFETIEIERYYDDSYDDCIE